MTKLLLNTIFLVCLFPTFLQAAEIHVSAAASLKEPLAELTTAYRTANPTARIFGTFGASGTLARQVESGAPADIFVSANPEWTDYLSAKSKLTKASIVPLAYNELVFAGHARASSLQELPRLQRIAIGSPKSVPAGEYALAALKQAGLESQLSGRLVMARDVRECLMYAERNEVDGAFVYRTDMLQAKHAKLLFVVPQKFYPKITYTMALTTAGATHTDARAFYRFLQSDAAKMIFKRYGFIVQ